MPTRQSGGSAPAPAQHIADCTHPYATVPQLQLTEPEPMYTREANTDGSARHSKHCKALFRRRDLKCHRCCELMAEALPRTSWHADYLACKLGQLQRRLPF